MKKLLIGLTLMTSITGYSQDYSCKDVYEDKRVKLEKNTKLRKFGRIAGVTSIAGAAGVAFVVGTGALPFVTIPIAAGLTGGALVGALGELSSDKRYIRLMEMINLQESLFITTEVYKQKIKENADLEKLEIERLLTLPSYRKKITESYNKRLFKLGKNPLSENLVAIIHLNDVEYKITTRMEKNLKEFKHPVQRSLNYVKAVEFVPYSTTFTEWRELLVMNQDEFCKEGKDLKKHDIHETIAKRIR